MEIDVDQQAALLSPVQERPFRCPDAFRLHTKNMQLLVLLNFFTWTNKGQAGANSETRDVHHNMASVVLPSCSSRTGAS